MSVFTSLLLPLDGSYAAARGMGCASWLADTLHSKIHILSATAHPLPAREELARLHVPEAAWPHVILHQAAQFPENAILAAAAEHKADLIIMSAVGEGAQAAPPASEPMASAGHVTRAIIERASAPVLLLPPRYREVLPWRRMLAPVSGEPEVDEALPLAVIISNLLELELHVVHVMGDVRRERDLATSAHYADAPHHEYPQQFTELMRQPLAHFTAQACRCIRHAALARGNVGAELCSQIEQQEIDVILIGWHGRFMAGHADVVKLLLREVHCPMLLVKPARRAAFKLKVGDQIA
jgi:nucleotide-binding universal stress UspA family protein